MLVKVCGMKSPKNIQAISKLPLDFIGFIFYKKSPRNISETAPTETPKHINRVGVFVNAEMDTIIEKIETYQLDYIQLHGDETPEYCQQILAKAHIKIIKAFRIGDKFPEILPDYEPFCEYFLFDTKGKEYGGTGKKFNWDILQQYKCETLFLLSGGIGEADATVIKTLQLEKLGGLDLNSKFEIEPGLKDINKITHFLTELKK